MSFSQKVTLNNNKIMDIYYELLNTFEVTVNIIILFLSTTKLLRVMLLSGIVTLVLHVGYNNNIEVIKMGRYINYYWFDIVLTISILTILSTLILMIKEAVDEIDKKFEHLKNTIRKKDEIIQDLNKKLMKK
jgi:hypothetical protein